MSRDGYAGRRSGTRRRASRRARQRCSSAAVRRPRGGPPDQPQHGGTSRSTSYSRLSGSRDGGHGQAPGGAMTAAGGNGPRVGNRGSTSSRGPHNALDGGMNPGRILGRIQGSHPAQAYGGGIGMGLRGDRLLGRSSFALNRATSSGGVLTCRKNRKEPTSACSAARAAAAGLGPSSSAVGTTTRQEPLQPIDAQRLSTTVSDSQQV